MRVSRIHWLASLVGGLGIAAWWAHSTIDPGTSAAGFKALFAATLGSPAYLTVALAFAALLAVVWVLSSRVIAGAWDIPGPAVASAFVPLLWGLGLPTLATILDLGTFWCTAPPLAALGLGLGAITSCYRLLCLRQERASPIYERDRLLIAAAAAVLPLLLLPSWPQPGGDEPHYLVAAHSIWYDGSLDLADDYASRVYAPYHPDALAPHTKPGLAAGSRHSMHGIGLPLLLLPGYVIGRRLPGDIWMVVAPRASLAVLFALFAWTLFGLVTDLAGRRAARAGTAATVLLAPLLFAPLHLFPAVPAMLLACAGFRGMRAARDIWRVLASALALAALPWIGVKFIPLAATIAAVGLLPEAPVRRMSRALIAGVSLAVSLLGHSLLMWVLYGTFSPASAYLGAPDAASTVPALGSNWVAYLAAWPGALATAVGYLIDQKEGLLAYGPHFILVAAGIPWLWRHRRYELLSLAAVGLAYIGPYALSQQLSGQGPPVRPLLAILWVLSPALGVSLALSSQGNRVFAAARGALLSLAACLTMVYASRPELLPHDYPVKASRLLRAYSPHGADWWRLFPQWVNFEQARWGVALTWAVLLALAVMLLMLAGSRLQLEATGQVGRPPVAWFSAAAAMALLCGLVVVHHRVVVVTGLHRERMMRSGLKAWVVEEAPVRIWAEAGGVWMRPGEAGSLVLTSDRPVQDVRAELGSLLETRVELDLQGTHLEGTAHPRTPVVATLRMNRGWRHADTYAYHCRLWADKGLSPALRGGSRDERFLGVFLSLSEVERQGAGE